MTIAVLVVSQAPYPTVHAGGSDAHVLIEPSDVTTEPGETVELTVRVEGVDHRIVDRGVTSEGLGVFDLSVHFDPAIVAVSEFEEGPFLGSTGRSLSCFSQVDPEDEGIFNFACVSSSPPDHGPQGSGVLARLTISAQGGGTTSLELTGELGGPLGSSGDDIPFDVTNGSVTVLGPPVPTSTPRPDPTPTTGSDDGANTGNGQTQPQGPNGSAANSSNPSALPGTGSGTVTHQQSPLLVAVTIVALAVLGTGSLVAAFRRIALKNHGVGSSGETNARGGGS